MSAAVLGLRPLRIARVLGEASDVRYRVVQLGCGDARGRVAGRFLVVRERVLQVHVQSGGRRIFPGLPIVLQVVVVTPQTRFGRDPAKCVEVAERRVDLRHLQVLLRPLRAGHLVYRLIQKLLGHG